MHTERSSNVIGEGRTWTVDPKQAADIISAAWEAVETSTVPAEPSLRATALGKAIDLMARSAAASLITGDRESATITLDRLSSKLQLSRDDVESVFTEDGGAVELTVHPARLATSKSAATRQIALLVAAQRQAGDEEQTPVDEIRRVAQEFGRYDPPNFSSALNELRGAVMFKGPPRQRTLRLTRAGWAQATDLVRQLTEG